MELREVAIKEEWEEFLAKCAEKTFLQSWSWGEFSAKGGSASGGNLPSKIWRFGVYSQGKLIGASLVLKIFAKRGSFLFIPHGPVLIDGLTVKDKKDALELVLQTLEDIVKEEKTSFIRISPIFLKNEENENIFMDLGFRPAPIHMHPEITWELDITLPEQELLANMRKTTRYLIRQAEKNPDIKIIKSANVDDLKLFWPVYKETAKRHGFVVFSEKYLQTEVNSFLPDNQIMIFLGKYKGEIVSAAIFVFWQDICFYHHSGSLSKYNKIPVSYLLQWEAIKEAKLRSCRTYNFWGIAPDANIKHPWAGLSLFKMGFGGYKKEYVKTQDLVFSNKYWINYLIEKIRRLKRGL